MAYGRKYFIEFTNVQNDVFHVYISEQEYSGNIYNLRGATDKPFTTSKQSGDGVVFFSLRATECTLNFVAENGIELRDFYSEDDDQFRIDFYCHSVNGTVIDKLLSSFLIVQDSCEQDFTAEPFDVTLKGTDNLALLKDVTFTTEGMSYDPSTGEYMGAISLFDFIKIALIKTGLSDLPLRVYSNIFETTTNDRSDSATAEMLQETFLDTSKYLNDDGTWKDMYTILQEILTTLNACLTQDNGAWNIVRRQESNLFTDNKIPGVEHNLSTGDKTAIELDYNWPIVLNSNIIFDKADAKERINRPFKFVKETFNFLQPASYIAHSNLQLSDGAVPYETTTVDGIKYDKYSLATYFPEWIIRGGITSYLEITTDVLTQTELDRYLVIIGGGGLTGGVQFNPIQVNKDDQIDIGFSVRALDGTSDSVHFWGRGILLVPGNQFYALVREELIIDSILYSGSKWYGPYSTDNWDSPADVSGALGLIPAYMFFSFTNSDPDWSHVDQYDNKENGTKIPFIPATGILLLQLNGTNLIDTDRHTTAVKDIKLEIKNFINQSTQIVGQYHNNKQPDDLIIKNNYDEEITIDDSPRNTIAGTLFTDALTNFNHTDITTGENTDVGSVHFTKTQFWHRKDIDEQRRLGEIIVLERMLQAYKSRTILDGTLYGVRRKNSADEWIFVSLLCLMTVDSLPGSNFIFGVLEVDWMNANYRAVLNELFAAADAEFDDEYIFQYLFKTK